MSCGLHVGDGPITATWRVAGLPLTVAWSVRCAPIVCVVHGGVPAANVWMSGSLAPSNASTPPPHQVLMSSSLAQSVVAVVDVRMLVTRLKRMPAAARSRQRA